MAIETSDLESIKNHLEAQESSVEKQQDTTIKLKTLPPRHYDVDLIDEFLSTVFHAGLDDIENILTWSVKPGMTPAYPRDDESLLDALERTKQARALYFGTSTCRRDPEGRLYNRKNLFEALHVVVLDDIGTKIDIDDLPDGLKPTYIVESSEGNYQYGFVLEEPVRMLPAAEALVQLVYESGYSDEGGKMATKLVRLPEDVNGKRGEKQGFVTKVHTMQGPYWTPQALLDALGVAVRWEHVLEDAEEVMRRRSTEKLGTSVWSPVKAVAPSLGGVIDPVLEWLYEENLVVDESGDWVTVRCPWGESHTSGEDTAGYKPIGRGDEAHRRGFHCFHEHCSSHKTPDFLQFVAGSGGPEAGVFDHAATLVSEWVYDAIDNCAWKVKDVKIPYAVPLTGFNNAFAQHSVNITTHDGKSKNVKETSLWLSAPARVTVYGCTFAPNTPAKFVTINGRQFINRYSKPDFPEIPIDQEHVDIFLDFVDYLIPNTTDREYFLNWITAKVQDAAFRGPALIMTTPIQGTGRTTLGDMLGVLVGQSNAENVDFEDIIGDSKYNEWLEKPLVISNETLTVKNTDYYTAYEKLKRLIDPRPQQVRINPKYGKQRPESIAYSSFIFLSNHVDAAVVSSEDRRFYVIGNTLHRRDAQYFKELNTWLDRRDTHGNPEWAVHVYNWMMKQPVNLEKLYEPPEMSAAKEAMIDSTRSPLEVGVEAVIEVLGPYIAPQQFKQCMSGISMRLNLDEINHSERAIDRMFKQATLAFPQGENMITKWEGKTVRPRVSIQAISRDIDIINPTVDKDLKGKQRKQISDKVQSYSYDEAIKAVNEILDLNDL